MLLEVANLHVHYGAAHAVKGVDFALDNGGALALMGRNGAGKSSTLKAIIGLVRPTSGTVRIRGLEVQRLPPERIARLGVGYVPEERRIFQELTVEENLEVGLERRRGAGRSALERAFALFPSLAERRNRLGRELSGGEQQMLAIARALVGDPSLLLLDEPSAGLAPKVLDQLAATLGRLRAQGLALLLSEQHLGFASLLADRVCVLEKGTVAFRGSLTELIADEERLRAHLGLG